MGEKKNQILRKLAFVKSVALISGHFLFVGLSVPSCCLKSTSFILDLEEVYWRSQFKEQINTSLDSVELSEAWKIHLTNSRKVS